MRFLSKSLSFLMVLLACATSALAADGRILSFEGDVRVNGTPANADTVLNSTDTISTAAGATVKIVLSDNSVLDIDSGSEIKLSDYSYDPAAPKDNKSDISVVEGTLRYVSGLIAKEDPNNIGFTAGNSTIGVRGSFTGIEVEGGSVNVEAMIGEATLIRKDAKGQKNTIVVPPGKTTQIDPKTGATIVTVPAMPNAVNSVVQAIAAASPDASHRLPDDEGCSQSTRPLRSKAVPDVNPELSAAIKAQLAALSKGELMMVMAVLINNANHLCIDSSTVANTITTIAAVRPDALTDVVIVATLLDPPNTATFTEAATKVPPVETETPPPVVPSEPPINNEIPPGGGTPPSPE